MHQPKVYQSHCAPIPMSTCYDVVLCSWQAVKIQELIDCMPGLMCPSPIMSQSQNHCDPVQSYCVPVPLCPSPMVSQPHSVPASLCPSTIMSQSHGVPTPFYPSPIVSQSHCFPAPLCPSPIMSQPLCVPVPLCPRPTESHSLGCDGPWKQWANAMLQKKRRNNGKRVLYFADALHNGFVVLCVKRKQKLDLASLWVHHVVGRGERCAHMDTINALQQSKQEKQRQVKNTKGLFQFLKQSCHHGHISHIVTEVGH